MKVQALALFSACFLGSAANAQSATDAPPAPTGAEVAAPATTAPAGEVSDKTPAYAALDEAQKALTAKIVIYRPGSIVGAGVACPVRYKGVEIVELGRGKFAEWDVPAGSYILANKTASVEVNLTPGQTKYVRCQIKPGFMTGRADLQIVDQESYAENAAKFERKEIATPNVIE
jgi:hypothetical protein